MRLLQEKGEEVPDGIGRTVIHLIAGSEGYGVALILRQISHHMPFVRFMALAPGEMTRALSREQLLWVGNHSLGVHSIGSSTLGGAIALLRILPHWWNIAKSIAVALPQDRILFHCHHLFMVLIVLLVKLNEPSAEIRILFHFHSTMNPDRLFGLLPKVQRFLIGHVVDGMIAVSNAVANYWRPVDCPIWVVYNGIDNQVEGGKGTDIHLEKDLHNIIIAGSLSRDKGHLVAVEAMKLLGSTGLEFHLWIAGGPLDEVENPFVSELRKTIERHGLGDKVTLLGYVNGLRNLLPKFWVGLQQRITAEPCSMWVLETLAAGLPLIASSTGGTPELVRHEVEGILVKPNDPRAVADAILRLVKDPQLRDQLAANAVARSRVFTVEKFLRNIREVYSAMGVKSNFEFPELQNG